MASIIETIQALKASDGYIEVIFMQGGCYQLHLFLKALYPNCEPLINKEKDHVVTYLDGKCYDITGEVEQAEYHEMSEDDLKLVNSWSFARSMALSLGECPNCEEPILI